MATKAPPKTKRSTSRLSEVANELVIPDGIVTTGWPAVREKCRDFGIVFDGWQEGLGTVALGKRADGKYAATVGGVVMSLPRQVGKTFFVGSILIAMCVLFPKLQVVWTAHHGRTSTKTFVSMQSMCKRRKVAPHIRAIRIANGEQEIHFTNGSVIYFGARAQGFGRGFDEVDVEVFDEAQILTEKALSDMIPATNQARHPHGALVFFMGTPPRPTDPGEAFTNKRKNALAGKSNGMVYVECSADRNAGLDDVKQWAKANPSYPLHTPHESMLRMRENLPDDDDWRREALGIWDDFEATEHIWDLELWDKRKTSNIPDVPEAIGFAVSIDQAWASIAASAMLKKNPYIGAVEKRRKVRHVAAEAARISREYGVPVAIDGRGPAAYLKEFLEAEGADVLVMSTDDVTSASADMLDRVTHGGLRHGNHAELNDAVILATTRNVGDRFTWGRRGGDISMLEAATCALWATTTVTAPDPLAGIA